MVRQPFGKMVQASAAIPLHAMRTETTSQTTRGVRRGSGGDPRKSMPWSYRKAAMDEPSRRHKPPRYWTQPSGARRCRAETRAITPTNRNPASPS